MLRYTVRGIDLPSSLGFDSSLVLGIGQSAVLDLQSSVQENEQALTRPDHLHAKNISDETKVMGALHAQSALYSDATRELHYVE